jgi:L-2-hydroxyglutarate oxidase LhgO
MLLVEKELGLATHQTGHNSGVIHTGIYYAPGSLKAKLCVAGHAATIQFCKERGIDHAISGKLIVALDESELPRLQNLYERGTANGVQGLEIVGPERLKEIEPFAVGIKAIWSPNTGVMSYKQMAAAIADDIRAWGGEVVTHCKLIGLKPGAGPSDPTIVQLGDPTPANSWQAEVTAAYVLTACGLHSDKVAELTTPDNDVKIIPFRGDYYLLRPDKRHMVKSMIYPVPDPSFPFLGVHFTRLLSGEVKAGPNAVLAFAREGYGRKDFNFPELRETLTYPGFHKLAIKYWKMGLLEMYRDYVKSAYVKALQRYMPAITGDDLLPGPSGVRAQALAESGKLVDDFLIRHQGRIIHVQNAPSPAATSSLAIAQHIVDEAESSFNLRQPVAVAL